MYRPGVMPVNPPIVSGYSSVVLPTIVEPVLLVVILKQQVPDTWKVVNGSLIKCYENSKIHYTKNDLSSYNYILSQLKSLGYILNSRTRSDLTPWPMH